MRTLLALVFVGLLAGTAAAQQAQFRLEGRPNVGVPFELSLIVEGFDEAPPPEQPKLVLPNAVATPLGVTPNVMSSIQIINGRRSESRVVTWSMRWRVEVSKEGLLRVPATVVEQGSKKATAPAGEVEVAVVPVADDMKLSLELPNRPVFVGETVPVTLTWLFQRSPQEQTFAVPILANDAFTASAPATTAQPQRGRTLTLAAGTKELQLPFNLDEVTVGGARYNRLTTTFFVAPRTAGKVEVPAASVVAALAVGRPDFFGNAPTRLFRAADTARSLEVKALPETGRPATFAGAVGDQFSIEVRTSRSVVSLGEPVELDVKIKSNQPLDTLSLGKLDGEGRLPRDRFTVPADPPTGELTDEGKTKTFKITAQVTGPTTEIPALAFSYFDPARGAYQTIHSEPVALSVKGGSVVGASDVVSAKPSKPAATTASSDDSVLVNADLALSSTSAVGDRPLGGSLIWLLVGLLYAVPLAIFGLRTYQVRTRNQREEASEVRAARKKLETLLDQAATSPARDVAGPLGAAFRELARTLHRTADDGGLLAKLETESFAPGASEKPLSADLRSDAAGLLRRWLAEARRAPKRASSATTAVLLLATLCPLALSRTAEASPIDDGRAAYQDAMALTNNPTARKAAFARAAIALGEAARAEPARPELLTDWGNAALGAGDLGTATLAYRRALAIDATTARARHNLTWLRSRQPEAFRPSTKSGATETLLFFHAWPRARKLLVGAGAFAVAVLLFVPWGGKRRRGLGGLAVIPFAIWVAMSASALFQDNHANDAVVMDDVLMRAADSPGAPPAYPQTLTRGVEVTLLEKRDAWTRIKIASGTSGWVPSGAVEKLHP
ncbi:MAG: hypothetical protein SFX73_12075 [Kofleriaceae bacterium]|nr:hypothetical protein [Kofleriaceae bacterium]